MLIHKIKIGVTEVQINEPLNFDKVEFSIIQDPDHFYRQFKFAGNSEGTELIFNEIVHENVFQAMLTEWDLKGSNTEIYYYIYNDAELIQDLRLDFSTAITDRTTFIECQAIVENAFKTLENNESLKLDLLSDKGADTDIYQPLQLSETYASPLGVTRLSEFTSNQQQVSKVTFDYIYWNLNRQAQIYDIDDTLSWLELLQTSRDWRPASIMDYQLIRFKDNYKEVKVNIEIDGRIDADLMTENPELTLYYGPELPDAQNWYDTVQKISLFKGDYNTNQDINIRYTKTFEEVPRGYGIWLCWRCRSKGAPLPTGTLQYSETKNVVRIVGTGAGFGSAFQSTSLSSVTSEVLTRCAKLPTSNFNALDIFNNVCFSGNQLRDLNKKFQITWNDIKSQLKERAIGFEYINNRLEFNSFEHFYQDFEITQMNSLQKFDNFQVSEDIEYHINTLEYKYKKFQAQKENALEGTAGTINGESQWKVANKFTKSNLSIDLPFVRDKFLIEDTRIGALAYNENTSTQNDDTLFLAEQGAGNYEVFETDNLTAQFNTETSIQSFANDNSFSWIRIGVKELTAITFKNISNGETNVMTISSVSHNLISGSILGGGAQFTGSNLFSFRFFLSGINYFLDMHTLNENYSIRQNLEGIKNYLAPYNAYTALPIINSEYKEDGTKEINGIVENSDILTNKSLFLPREYEMLFIDTIDKFKIIRENPNGYLSVYNEKGDIIKVYIKELHMTIVDCERAKYKVIGLIKND